ncbi:hypothetical protein [Granulicella sp. L60]|uniref:hypothetical protein n=1 Tax=Granulicella sp. L60 TaxID=1641866 RepID=UPI00131E2458|nr:hypothetical protein [Granulicella sp. L60]
MGDPRGGGEADARARDLEFSTRSGVNGAELMALFVKTKAAAKEVIRAVSQERLAETTGPHDGTVAVMEAILAIKLWDQGRSPNDPSDLPSLTVNFGRDVVSPLRIVRSLM